MITYIEFLEILALLVLYDYLLTSVMEECNKNREKRLQKYREIRR